MNNYRTMVETAVKNGSGEKAMWASVNVTSEVMEYLKEKDQSMYNHFMRKSYEAMCGKHYNRFFAEEDVSKLHYTNKDGEERHGAHWTLEQVLEATDGYEYPEGTTEYDRYVAYNAAYADFSKKFDDEQVLCIGYLFFFADEDWKGEGKIWSYMGMNK